MWILYRKLSLFQAQVRLNKRLNVTYLENILLVSSDKILFVKRMSEQENAPTYSGKITSRFF